MNTSTLRAENLILIGPVDSKISQVKVKSRGRIYSAKYGIVHHEKYPPVQTLHLTGSPHDSRKTCEKSKVEMKEYTEWSGQLAPPSSFMNISARVRQGRIECINIHESRNYFVLETILCSWCCVSSCVLQEHDIFVVYYDRETKHIVILSFQYVPRLVAGIFHINHTFHICQ